VYGSFGSKTPEFTGHAKSKNYLMQNSIWHKLKSPKQNRTALAIILGEAEIPRD
jgi:hypothetical protein